MSNALLHTNETAPRTNAMTPMEMVQHAVSSGAGIEVIGKLMDLQERWEAGQARKAFDQAIAAAKSNIPVIGKNREGHNDNRYADFAAIARAVDPILAEHGLSYRFRTRQDERIHVTCVLSHEAGHSEETTLAGPADSSGSKNAIQAIGSTLTYLQRYTLVQALGLAASEDDDGASMKDVETITEDQEMMLRELNESKGAGEAQLLKFLRLRRLRDLPASRFEEVVRTINTFKKGR